MEEYFVEMQADQIDISSRLLQTQNKLFSFLLTYSPLRQTKDMYILHHHYKKTQLMAAMEKTKNLQQEVKEVCMSLDPSFSSTKDCNSSNFPSQVDQSHHQSSAKCLPNGVIPSVPEPYHPRSIYDYLPWEYFDSKTIYRDKDVQPNYNLKIKRDVENELQQALNQAMQKTVEELGQRVKFKKLVNGWVRHDPFVGNEYIIDYLFTYGKEVISKRAHLVRPLARNYISLKDEFVDSKTVNIVMPINGVNQRFTKFMSMYENLVFLPRKNVNLVLSVYGHEDTIEVNNTLARYRVKYKHAHVTVVEGKGEFSRSKALHLGMSQLLPNDLVFICDVDMVITSSFLDRCRSNAVQSSRVYFPEVFKQYNMDYVYWDSKKPSHQHSIISRATGYWAYFAFGMFCIYKSDYDSVGGMDTNITGWGDEDVSFFQSVLKKGLQVMRAPDVGLSHQWHPKYCAKTLSTMKYKKCQFSKLEDLADRKELARFVYAQPSPLNTTTVGG